ncbi:Sbm Methylmalonyl-CoA mutase, C-terminal domain/subunit (cobalamin-binding) [Candidatus Nanopelagicaceae bacterium]
MNIPIRVLIAKVGLDGHDRGAKIVSRTLRDAGFEVIYSGLHQTPKQIVRTAIQEDVKAIGVSILSGAHMEYFQKIMLEMSELGIRNVLVFGGGIIPANDIEKLKEIGVGRIFTPGSSLDEIPSWLGEEIADE